MQLEAGSIWEYVMEPFAKLGVYKGVVADLPMTREAIYNRRTAAVHMTGGLQTYETVLWGPGVRSTSCSCCRFCTSVQSEQSGTFCFMHRTFVDKGHLL
jgi:hypothetical protein